jgi:hypothetical protein
VSEREGGRERDREREGVREGLREGGSHGERESLGVCVSVSVSACFAGSQHVWLPACVRTHACARVHARVRLCQILITLP